MRTQRDAFTIRQLVVSDENKHLHASIELMLRKESTAVGVSVLPYHVRSDVVLP